MTDQFISEPMTPVRGTSDTAAMARGEPGMPREFRWRDRVWHVCKVLRVWKSTGMDRGEKYLRRHWYEVETEEGMRMVLYCQRQAGRGLNPRRRWWVYSVGAEPK